MVRYIAVPKGEGDTWHITDPRVTCGLNEWVLQWAHQRIVSGRRGPFAPSPRSSPPVFIVSFSPSLLPVLALLVLPTGPPCQDASLLVVDGRGAARRLVILSIASESTLRGEGLWRLFLTNLSNITFVGAGGQQVRGPACAQRVWGSWFRTQRWSKSMVPELRHRRGGSRKETLYRDGGTPSL